MTRVVITGAGVVSPIGSGLEDFFHGLHAASRGVDHISSFDTAWFPSTLGAEAREQGTVFRSDHPDDRKSVFIRESMDELFRTGLVDRYAPSDRILHMGAGIDYFDFLGYVKQRTGCDWHRFSQRSYRVASTLAEDFSIKGGHFVNVSACVASTQAMGFSLRLLRNTHGKAVISGGFDSMLSHLHYMGFYSLGALSEWKGEPSGACRPFDRNRCGLVIGEGAGVYLFEREESAERETILCEVAGYGSTMDAYMVTDPEPTGRQLAQAALLAIHDAGITPDDIDTVDMHGTGTVKNAVAEARAMELVFPERYREIPVFTLKGQIGHSIGACGAVEILGVIDMLKQQRVLPSVNCDDPDPEVPLHIVRGEPLPMRINHVLKLNAAFGGQNTALVFRKYGQ
ncbi:MAG TPA: beta-ketoacyl-[acyl-carrier-protein] synthase family protein [Nitrospirota bacterium]|nr:beta-ketoacyl-[acyl-carrier-protein] synthase family protein [Nitrospirota bacterium]